MREKLKVRRFNKVQLLKDRHFGREIQELVGDIDSAYKSYCEWGPSYLANEDSINEKNYSEKRGVQLEKAKDRMLNYYRNNLRRIVNTLKIEILIEMTDIYEEGGNFDLFFMENLNDFEHLHLSEEEIIEEYINTIFEVPLEILRDKSQRYYTEIRSFIRDAILERESDKAYEILEKNVCIKSRQVKPQQFIFGISDEENFVFSEECLPFAFDMMIYSAVISILYEIEQQVLQELKEGFIADDVRKTGYDLTNTLQNMTIYITLQKIFNMLSGRDDKEPSPQVKKIIKSTLENLSNVTVKVSDPELNRTHYRDSNGKIHLLPMVATEGMRINRRKRNYALRLYFFPPLYELARNEQKLLGIDVAMLDVPLENGVDNIALKGYLLRQIAIAKGTHTKEFVISYKKLYRSIGIKVSGKGMSIEEQNKIHLGQMEIRKKVKKCLDFWREKKLIRRADTKSTKRAIIYM